MNPPEENVAIVYEVAYQWGPNEVVQKAWGVNAHLYFSWEQAAGRALLFIERQFVDIDFFWYEDEQKWYSEEHGVSIWVHPRVLWALPGEKIQVQNA